jgi:hypothetical protein
MLMVEAAQIIGFDSDQLQVMPDIVQEEITAPHCYATFAVECS